MKSTSIRVQRLAGWTIYKIIFLGTTFSLGIFCVLMGVLALFGANTVMWNGANVYGFSGLFVSILLAVFFVFAITLVFGTACLFGIWLYSKFETMGISYVHIVEVEAISGVGNQISESDAT